MTHVPDHEESRNRLKMLLEANGYRVTIAGDGLECWTPRPDPPNPIISDVPMPNIDGFALCRLSCFPMRLLIETRQTRRSLCISRIEYL